MTEARNHPALSLKWFGPYALFPSDDRLEVYSSKEAASAGLYLWAVPIGGEYLVHYVGVTADNIADRQAVHMQYFLSGDYTLYDPEAFRNARKVSVYEPGKGVSDYLSRYDELSGIVARHTQAIHVFVAPLDANKVMLERIESSIIESLRNAGGEVAGFLGNMKISRWVPTDERIPVSIDAGPILKGVPELLWV